METDLYNTRDQAIIALVVDEAEKLIGSQRGYLGRTALQKVLYFLDVFGIPMRYRFDVHHYGPFCQQILSDVDWLTFTGAIEDQSTDSTKYSNYRISLEGKRLIEEFGEDVEEYRQDIRDIASALVPLSPDRLELLATLHYVYRELMSSSKTPSKEEVLKRFHEFEKDKFEKHDINTAYDCLLAAKLITSRKKNNRRRS